MDLEQEIIRTLIEKKKITHDQLHVLQEEHSRTGVPISQLCVQLRIISASDMLQIRSDLTQIPYIHLSTSRIDWETVYRMDFAFQKQHHCLIFQQDGDQFSVAMTDPEDLLTRDIIQQHVAAIHAHSATHSPAHSTASLLIFYITHEDLAELYTQPKHPANTLKESAAALYQTDEAPHLLDSILQEAVLENVSDIHFQPEAHLVTVRYRVDGLLRIVHSMHFNLWQRISVRLKLFAKLDIAELRRPQSGHFEKEINGQACDFRISSHPTIEGENIVVRILYKQKKIRPLPELGFDENSTHMLLRMIQEPHGLFLICGPTGSGKTTTLYTLCAHMDAITRNIMTLEEPIEYKLENVRQTEIHPNGVMRFADGVRSILRQDPDVIFIGEIRDEDTAQIALRAAMTGHLVLATLHANDAARVPSRLMDLGISPTLLSGQILLILSQRLVRSFCPHCKGEGCAACLNSGFRGRTAISELFPINPEMDQAIAEAKPVSQLRHIAHCNNWPTMYENGLQKVRAKITSLEEVHRVLGQSQAL